MAVSWRQDKTEKADPYEPEVKRILQSLGHYFVRIDTAPMELDRTGNADLLVRLRGERVACRIRDVSYWHRGYRDVTIRNKRFNGSRSEADKLIVDQAGRWMFYGWGAQGKVLGWVLIDLDRVRSARLVERARGESLGGTNADMSSDFVAIPLEWLMHAKATLVYGGIATEWIAAQPPGATNGPIPFDV